jgi:hypothetical protein
MYFEIIDSESLLRLFKFIVYPSVFKFIYDSIISIKIIIHTFIFLMNFKNFYSKLIFYELKIYSVVWYIHLFFYFVIIHLYFFFFENMI